MDDELVQEIRPLDPGGGRAPRRRARIALTGWVVVITSVVVVGLAGPRGSAAGDPEAAQRDRTPAASTPTDEPARSPRPISVAILEPSVSRTTITTQRLAVSGYLAAPVRYVDVRLESRGQHTLERFDFRPDAAPSAGRPVAFATEFDLPALRPNGTMWVFVVGYNDRGIPVDATRRRIDIGELVGPVPAPTRGPGVRPSRPTAGFAI